MKKILEMIFKMYEDLSTESKVISMVGIVTFTLLILLIAINLGYEG